MELTFDVLNEEHTYEGIDSFTVTQLGDGTWQVVVEGDAVYNGEFAPTNVSGSD